MKLMWRAAAWSESCASVKRFVATTDAESNTALPAKREYSCAANHALPPVLWALAVVAIGRSNLTLLSMKKVTPFAALARVAQPVLTLATVKRSGLSVLCKHLPSNFILNLRAFNDHAFDEVK